MFKNETIYTNEVIRESYIAILMHRKSMQFSFLVILFQFFLTITLIIFEYINNIMNLEILQPTGIMLAVIIYVILINNRRIKREQNRLNVLYQGNEAVLTYEIGDNIVESNMNTGGTNIYEYTHIHKIVESRNLITLFTQGNLRITLKKSGFTQGSWSECLKFIRQKHKSCKKKNHK